MVTNLLDRTTKIPETFINKLLNKFLLQKQITKTNNKISNEK